jgi:hypothetical protein
VGACEDVGGPLKIFWILIDCVLDLFIIFIIRRVKNGYFVFESLTRLTSDNWDYVCNKLDNFVVLLNRCRSCILL